MDLSERLSLEFRTAFQRSTGGTATRFYSLENRAVYAITEHASAGFSYDVFDFDDRSGSGIDDYSAHVIGVFVELRL